MNRSLPVTGFSTGCQSASGPRAAGGFHLPSVARQRAKADVNMAFLFVRLDFPQRDPGLEVNLQHRGRRVNRAVGGTVAGRVKRLEGDLVDAGLVAVKRRP